MHRDRLRAVKTADVQRVWATLPQARRIARRASSTPPRRPIARRFRRSRMSRRWSRTTRAMRRAPKARPSIRHPPTSRRAPSASKLPGGLEIALLPKKTRGGAVFAALSLRFGDEQSLRNRRHARHAWPPPCSCAARANTRASSCRTNSTGSRRASTSTPGARANTHHIETTRENLPAVLTLLTEVLREPAFDPQGARAVARRMACQHGAAAQRAIGARVHAVPAGTSLLIRRGDIRYVQTIDEGIASVKAVTREQVREIPSRFLRRAAGAVRGGR